MPLQEVTQYYHELHPDAFIKQPWNTYSSLFFFLPVIYWLWKLRGQYRQYPVLMTILPLAFLNGIGSTLWHANNGGRLYGMLDVFPPLLMMLFLCVYFWRMAINSWGKAVLLMLVFLVVNIGLLYLLATFGGQSMAVNVYYLLMGVLVVTPNVWLLRKYHWQGWYEVALALGFIGLALLFRSLDRPTPNPFPETLPQGTHFLWHLVSVGAMFPLGYYLIRLQKLHRAKA